MNNWLRYAYILLLQKVNNNWLRYAYCPVNFFVRLFEKHAGILCVFQVIFGEYGGKIRGKMYAEPQAVTDYWLLQ